MIFTLDEAQTEVLREVLDSASRDLRYEIANTDNHDFKQKLKERAEVLHSILEVFPARG